MLKQVLFGAALWFLILASAVQAHYVWWEGGGYRTTRAYFGDWQLDRREKPGGLLDRIKSPRAFLASANQDLPIQRRADDLEIASKGVGDLRLVERGIAPR